MAPGPQELHKPTLMASATSKYGISTENEGNDGKPLADVVFILDPQHVSVATATSQKQETSHSMELTEAAIQLSNEYAKSDTYVHLRNLLLEKMGYKHVEIKNIHLLNYMDIISDMAQYRDKCVIFNMCDGCETDGYPGISIVRELENQGLAFTGAGASFFTITTSKPVLKRALMQLNVPTSPFVEITASTKAEGVDAIGGYPLIVKPSISYASISITDKRHVHNAFLTFNYYSLFSVVFSAEEALRQAKAIHGVGQGVFVERFLSGREFTAFVMGDAQQGLRVLRVAERVFNEKLQTYQRILAFDRYWDGYDLQGNKPQEQTDPVYKYAMAPEEWQPMLVDIASRAYLALGGSGYGRVDMRTDGMESKDVYVLEVNANCGVSFNVDEFTSTVSEILRISKESVPNFTNQLIAYALGRKRQGEQ
jgi:D-alanine-D-alanine ligase-like ATP-grasp enzyme